MIPVQISLSSISVENIEEDADKFVDYLNSKCPHMLGSEFAFKAEVSRNLGSSIYIEFYRSGNPTPDHNISKNSVAYFSFIMHLTGSFGESTDLPKVKLELMQQSRQTGKRGANIKYRAISSSISIMDVAKKFEKWLKKTEEAIKGVQ
jgi:hypothetical protein